MKSYNSYIIESIRQRYNCNIFSAHKINLKNGEKKKKEKDMHQESRLAVEKTSHGKIQ